MRNYEAVFVFRAEDELYNQGKQLVADELAKVGATIVKEEDMGNRELAYEIKSETRGHYHFFETQIPPEKLAGLDAAVRLMSPVLKYLFVKK